MRHPKFVGIERRSRLLLTKETEKDQKTSLFHIEAAQKVTSLLIHSRSADDDIAEILEVNLKTQNSLVLCIVFHLGKT